MDSKVIAKKNLTGIPETMLIPLWAKAEETQRVNPIISDTKAEKIIKTIDYDFSKFNKSWMSQTGIAIRTYILDRAVEKFLSVNDNAIIINLGAGLDTRYERLSPRRIKCWYDLDVPEAIRFREKFFPESKKNQFIEKSVFDYSWLNDIDRNDEPILIIAEGLFMYFSEEEIKNLFEKLVRSFPEGEIYFEMLAHFLVNRGNIHDTLQKTGNNIEFKWGLNDSRSMERWNKKIEFIEEWNYLDYFRNRWKILGFIALIPPLKNLFNNRIVHMKFSR